MNPKTSEQPPEAGGRAGGAEGSLGEQLRRARTERGMGLRELSEQTRITMRHLEAIEADDYKTLPGGIFNKSFVKSYARHVGFPEARALELYERTSRERGFHEEEPPTSPQRSRVYMGESSRSPLMTYGLSILIVGLLALLVYAGLHYYRRSEAEQAGGPAATPTPAAPQQQTAAATPTPAPQAADGLNVTVKANSEVWMRVLVDEATAKGNPGQTWPAGQSQTFAARDRIILNYARSLAGALEVTANGSALRPPTDTRPGVSQEWVITRDNFRQFAQ